VRNVLTEEESAIVAENGEKHYMNIHTGSVDKLKNWAADYESMDSEYSGGATLFYDEDGVESLVEVAHTLDEKAAVLQELIDNLGLGWAEDNNGSDFCVYKTNNEYFKVADDQLDLFCGKFEDVKSFLECLDEDRGRPNDPYENDWIYSKIHEAIVNPSTGICEYDEDVHGEYGCDTKLILVHNNGYDTLLHCAPDDYVLSEWQCTPEIIREYLKNGNSPDDWVREEQDVFGNGYSRISHSIFDYGQVVGRHGRIEDIERREFWGG